MWNEREVWRWLKQKGLGRLWRNFHGKKVDGKVLLQITSQYLDHVGVSNSTSRDKLLAAVHELKLFGGPVPDERQFRLGVPGSDDRGSSQRPKRRSLPARPANMQLLVKGMQPDSIENGNSQPLNSLNVVERKTPQEVLQEQAEEMMSEIEKGKVQVQTTILNPETEYTSIEITNQTTSKQLISLLLEQSDALSKDHNLFYVAVEIGIQKKDSSLPISHMMVLADDARPLEIQTRQATGEAKFHLKMRSGGLLRVQAGILSPGATYKCVQISRQTRADEVVKMILSSYGSDEPPEKFVLVESLSDSEVGRILEADECPLEVQSRWKTGDQGTFTLTQAEFEGVLQSDEKTRPNRQESLSDNEKHKYNDDQQISPSTSETEDKETLEQVRKRRTSIDALDLHIDSNAVTSNQVKRKVSQIDNLRHKFHQYNRKPSAAVSSDGGDVEGPKKRKVSQIDVFRSKFLAYYGGKTEGSGALDSLSENVTATDSDGESNSTKKSPPLRTPSFEHSDSEELPRFSSSPPTVLHDNDNIKGSSSQQRLEHKQKESDLVPQGSQTSRLSLASVLQHSKLFTVTLNRKPGEGWGIELVHVTKTGSSMSQDESSASEDEKVVYVQHNGNGQNSIMDTSCARDISFELITPSGTSTPHSGSSTGSSEHEIMTILGTNAHSSAENEKQIDDMRHIVHKQNLRRKMGSITNIHPAPERIPISSERPGSATNLRPIKSLPQRPSSALAQWRKEGSPQHRPGVRIVALTEDGVAEKSNELAVDDLIVEINGQLVLNSPLEPVIAAMKEANTVTVVVARAQSPEPKPEEKENKTDYKDDIKALTLQIQNLVTKVSEMQNDLKKKDDKIKTLKKMVKKSGLDSKGKIYQSVQVLV